MFMTFRIRICLLFLAAFWIKTNAQNTQDTGFDRKTGTNKFGPIKSHFEATANVTTVISRFSGNLTRAMEEDPYLVALKYYFAKPRIAVRLGLNGDYQQSTKFNNNSDIRTQDKQFMPLLGFELRRVVAPRLEVYTGLDFRLYRTYSSLTTTDNLGTSKLVSDTRGYGAGPCFGFTFFLSRNIRLFTEANLYANFIKTHRTLSYSGTTQTLEDYKSLQFKPVVPASLFLSICF